MAPDLLLIDDPRFAGVVELLQPVTSLYRPIDIYTGLKHYRGIGPVEQRLVWSCDGVVATSAPVLAHIRSIRTDVPQLLLENGVEFEHFDRFRSEPLELKTIARPRILYVGTIDERFDFDTVTALARKMPNWQLVLIGEHRVRIPTSWRSQPNIHYFGPRAYQQVPAYVHWCDIGLLPLNGHPANDGRSPMKLYEFAAAGKPVVASNTLELRRRALGFVALVDSMDEYISSCRRLMNLPDFSDTAKRAAMGHDWRTKSNELLDFAQKIKSGDH